MTLEFYLNRISKMVHEPFCCPEQNYRNENPVIHWHFSGDGESDAEEYSSDANPEIVKEYIKYCQTQVTLAQEYLESLDTD